MEAHRPTRSRRQACPAVPTRAREEPHAPAHPAMGRLGPLPLPRLRLGPLADIELGQLRRSLGDGEREVPRPARSTATAAAVGFAGLAVFQMLLAAGALFGEAAWGGTNQGQLPTGLRVGSGIAIVIYGAAAAVILARAGFRVRFVPGTLARVGSWVLAALAGARIAGDFLLPESMGAGIRSARSPWYSRACVSWLCAAPRGVGNRSVPEAAEKPVCAVLTPPATNATPATIPTPPNHLGNCGRAQ